MLFALLVNPLKSDLWSSPMALWMATRPLPSLDWPSLLSRAYMFFSEKLQPRKSKWAEFTAISLGYSMFSTCTERWKCCGSLDVHLKKEMVPYVHLLPYEDQHICQGHNSKHREGRNSTGTSLMITECYDNLWQFSKNATTGAWVKLITLTCWLSSGRLFPYMKQPRLEAWPCKST